METTVNWLKRYCAVSQTPEQIEQLLTLSGSEVEKRQPVAATHDTAYKLEITSNRTDCYGTLGLARELSALTGVPVVPPKADYKTLKERADEKTSVTVECPDLCPFYSAQLIRNVKVGPSPKWLLDLFETLASLKDIRPINNVVDITNFVLLELSQPLHAFDYDKLAGKRIVVRRAKKGEKIRALNDKEYTFDETGPTSYWRPDICVIADAERPQCIGGVMGGKDSEITADTTTVLLESAYFDPLNIRATSRGLDLHSDSSYRFSRGVDPGGVIAASRRCAALIAEICGGEVYDGILQVGSLKPYSATIRFPLADIKRLLLIDVPPAKVLDIFQGLGLTVDAKQAAKVRKGEAGEIEVTIPSYRRDLAKPIDLIEEVGRIIGYDKVPTTTTLRIAAQLPKTNERTAEVVSPLLTGAGYHETVTASFVPETGAWLHTPWHSGGLIKTHNPMMKGRGLLRPALVQSLLEVRRYNQDRGEPTGLRLFELARVYGKTPVLATGKLPAKERRVLAATCDGVDAFLEIKGLAELIVSRLQITPHVAAIDNPLLEPKRAVGMYVGGENLQRLLGMFGLVRQTVLDEFGLLTPCAALELDFDALVELAVFDKKFRDMPRFPAVTRELAVIVPERVLWQDLVATVKTRGGDWLMEVRFLDEYRGKQIPPGRKQYNLAMRFQAPQRSLTSDEVNAVVDGIVAALKNNHDGDLRR